MMLGKIKKTRNRIKKQEITISWYMVKDLSTDARRMCLDLRNAKLIRELTTVFDKKRK